MRLSPGQRELVHCGAIALVVMLLVALVASAAMRDDTRPTPSPSPSVATTPSAVIPSVLSPSSSPTPSPGASPAVMIDFLVIEPGEIERARTTLPSIMVAADLAMDGYSREAFGPSWTDNCTVEGCDNSCDTRNDILARDLINETFKADGCTVLTGILHDPYTGKTINFVRGTATSGRVQIDHIIPLAEAWRTGARTLSQAERINLANDPRNLVAVDGPTNGSKSDQDAAEWLPPQPDTYCAYAVAQVEVKFAYRLWMSQAEHDTLADLLTGC